MKLIKNLKNPFTEKTSKILMYFGIILFSLGIVLFLWGNIDFDKSKQIDATKFGQFGDFVGGLIGSLWAFAGVILFYVALTEQREDIKTNRKVLNTQVNALKQQIKEFELQREELELTREVFIEQSTTLKLQQFESTYFNSLNLLNNIIQNINYLFIPPTPVYKRLGDEPIFPQPDKSKTFVGRDAFEFFYNDLKQEYQKTSGDYVIKNIKEAYTPGDEFNIPYSKKEELLNNAYEIFFKKKPFRFGTLF